MRWLVMLVKNLRWCWGKDGANFHAILDLSVAFDIINSMFLDLLFGSDYGTKHCSGSLLLIPVCTGRGRHSEPKA